MSEPARPVVSPPDSTEAATYAEQVRLGVVLSRENLARFIERQADALAASPSSPQLAEPTKEEHDANVSDARPATAEADETTETRKRTAAVSPGRPEEVSADAQGAPSLPSVGGEAVAPQLAETLREAVRSLVVMAQSVALTGLSQEERDVIAHRSLSAWRAIDALASVAVGQPENTEPT